MKNNNNNNNCKNCVLQLHNHNGVKNNLALPCEKSFLKGAEIFQILSDPTRMKILWLLCHSKLCVNNIATTISISAPAVSHHLKLLKSLSLIENSRSGKEMYYKITDSIESNLVHNIIDNILDFKCSNIVF
jgi:DNA-binding transcriptional ArsR family regulator